AGNVSLSAISGVTVKGNLAVNNGSLTALNSMTVQGDVNASQNINLGDATVQGALFASAGNISGGNITSASLTAGQRVDAVSLQSGPVTVGTTLNVVAGATISGNVSAGTSINVGGEGMFGGNISAGNGIRVNGFTHLNGNTDQAINAGAGVLTLNNWTLKDTPGGLLVNAPGGITMEGVGDQGILN